MKPMTLKPVISEKTMAQAARGKYVFDVPTATNKIEVARAVQAAFKVTVEDVNMQAVHGKLKRVRGITGRRAERKRAIVTVKKGQTIKAFEVETE